MTDDEDSPMIGYHIERYMYAIGLVLGSVAVLYMGRKLLKGERELIIAARLVSYKISLTVADMIILFVYAPAQLAWITTFWWYGGDILCRGFKFTITFAFHLTANMQVLIAFDRVYITSRLNQVCATRKDQGYNPRTYLTIAWAVALVCALPQLFIFGVDNQVGSPQCVSLWTKNRFAYHKEKLELQDYDWYLDTLRNETFKIKPKPVPKPTKTLEDIENAYYQVLVIEQVYNIFHLATICVVPYVVELLCYACIMYLLKGATNGHFLSLKDIRQMSIRWCVCPNIFKNGPRNARSRRRQIHGETPMIEVAAAESDRPMRSVSVAMGEQIVVEVHDEERNRTTTPVSEPVPSTSTGIRRIRRLSVDDSKLCPPTPNGPTRVACIASIENGQDVEEETDHETTNEATPKNNRALNLGPGEPSTSAGLTAGSSTADEIDDITSIRSASPMFSGRSQVNTSRSFLLSPPRRERRRASAPPPGERGPVRPWMNTLAEARRKTRRKAFLMLTLNLIFWGPYCLLGIITAITVFENYHNFNFVCALLVFNAITNILL